MKKCEVKHKTIIIMMKKFELKSFCKKLFHLETPETDNTGGNDAIKNQVYDVFISKNNADSEMAKDVCSFLERNGFKCFISEREVPAKGSTNYHQTIDEALEHSTNMVVVCSRAENLTSDWVQYEWQAFSSELKSSHRLGNIITIRGNNVKRGEIPFGLRNLELLDWNDYKSHLLAYIVKPNVNLNITHNPNTLIDNISTNQRYSDAFMLGLKIGLYGLDSIHGMTTSPDSDYMKSQLSGWNLPMDKVEPLLRPGKGMDFLNSIIDVIGEHWGSVYENCAYLGTVYYFYFYFGSKKGGNAATWNERFVQICQKIGVPQHIFQSISHIDVDGMIAFRDVLRQTLDNLDNSVTKCKCCDANIGFDYDACPNCGLSINRN